MKLDEMPGEVTFLRMPRSKPKTSAEGQEQLSNSLARMASAPAASKRVPITEIGFAQCRFVVDDRSFPALCCGEPTLGGSWCAHHRALVFVRVAASPNHRKSAQEPAKAPAGTPAPGPNGPERRLAGQAAKPATDKLPSSEKKAKPQHVGPSAQRGDMPAKGVKPPEEMTAKKDGAGAVQRATPGPKESAKISGKQAAAAPVRHGNRPIPAKKPESSRTSAAAKPASKKAAPSAKGKAAKKPASAKKAAASRKSSATKRPAPPKKAVASRKSSAAKRPLPAKKPTAMRKSNAAKQRSSAKKKTAAGKRKTR
jgi:hypothetical protein